MAATGGAGSFHPLSESIKGLEAHIQTLEGQKFKPLSKAQIGELNTKLQSLASDVKLFKEYLTEAEVSSLQSLSGRGLEMLQAKNFPLMSRLLKTLDPGREQVITVLKEVGNVTKSETEDKEVVYVKILMNAGRDEDAYRVLDNIPDTNFELKAKACIELVKIGDIDSALKKIAMMKETVVLSVVDELNKEPTTQLGRAALSLLPRYLLLGGYGDSAIKVAEQIKDPELKMKAYVQLSEAGGMHQIIQYAKSIDKGVEFLVQLRAGFFGKGVENDRLPKAFVKAIDVELEGLQKSQSTSEVDSSASSSLPDKDVQGPEIAKKRSFLKRFRKMGAEVTGLHGFFSGKKASNEPEVDELEKMSNGGTESVATESSIQTSENGVGLFEREEPPSQSKEIEDARASSVIETSQIAEPVQEQLSPLKKLENYIGNPAASNLLMGFIGNTEMSNCMVSGTDMIAVMGRPQGDAEAAKEEYINFVDTFIKKQGFSKARAALIIAFKGYPEATIPVMMNMTKSEAGGKTTLDFYNSEESILIGGVAIRSITYPTEGSQDNKATLVIATPDGSGGWFENSDLSLSVKL